MTRRAAPVRPATHRVRLAVVGVGEASRGDDGFGPRVCRHAGLEGRREVLDAGPDPEAMAWRLRDLRPEVVLFVDAVDMAARPGEVSLLRPGDLREEALDTHHAPLRLLMRYLETELGCRCLLLGVQPADIREGAPMTSSVRAAADSLALALGAILARSESPEEVSCPP